MYSARLWRRLVIGWSVLALAAVLVRPVGGTRAPAEWEPTGLDQPASRLYTPASGTLFASVARGLWRSDDAGDTWRPVSLPPEPGDLAIDPTDHTILYAAGTEGVYKSDDDAASWRLVYPIASRSTGATIAVSPADHRAVYLQLTTGSMTRMLRSQDGGASWEELFSGRGDLCNSAVLLVEWHPTDPNRLFRTTGCYAGRDTLHGDGLDVSTDRGATWSGVLTREERRAAFPRRLVGGSGVAAGRYYVLGTARSPSGPASTWLFRSDDDGATWTAKKSWCCPAGEGPVGLAYDPHGPDRVYVVPIKGGVKVSADGGESWDDLGERGLTDGNDVALGVDGGYLYAATDRGVFRLRLR